MSIFERFVAGGNFIFFKSQYVGSTNVWISDSSLCRMRLADSDLPAGSAEDAAGAQKDRTVQGNARRRFENTRNRRASELLPRIYSKCFR